jgi:short-subunit dehydrogenase
MIARPETLGVVAALTAGAVAARRTLRRRRAFDFRDAFVLITGASRGLGLVLARQLLGEGVAGIAICARDAAELERARAELAQHGRVLAVPADVTDREHVDNLVRVVSSQFGRLDVVVNNAGTITVGPLETMTIEDFEEALRSNFWAAVYVTLAVLPDMRRRGRGRIVNIASIGGKIAVPHLLPYTASKFALVGFSSGLRAEVAKDGIFVTTVCPGLMRTGSPRNAEFKGQHRAEYAWFSLGDALPISSMSADRAARQIIEACRRGEAEVVLSIQAKTAATFHGLFPGVTAELLSVVNRLLPAPGGIGSARAKGKDSESLVSPSVLTALGDRAAVENNQVASRRDER